MDPVGHLIGLILVATVIGALGIGLALLNAAAVRLALLRGPWPVVPVLVVAAPALLWAGFGLYMLGLMAADPTAANLWPLTLALMAFAWLAWSAVTGVLAAILRFARRA